MNRPIPTLARMTWLAPVYFALFSLALFCEPVWADRIAFVGNSLLHHGPSPEVGWVGDWGMAASSADHDYAGRTVAMLRQGGKDFAVQVLPANVIEANFFVVDADRKAWLSPLQAQQDVFVLEIGDNIKYDEANPRAFSTRYADLLRSVESKLSPSGRLICVSKWWPNAVIDQQIRTQCEAAHGAYVDIGSIARQSWGPASAERPFKDPGVGSHPGDRAMQAIAARIVDAVVSSKSNPVR